MDPAYILSLNPVVVVEVLFLIIIMVFLFLFFGAIAAGVQDVTWTKILLASLIGITAQWVVAVSLSIIPLVGGLVGFIFSILAMIYVLRYTFMVSWRRAALIFGLASVAEIATGTVLELYTGIGFLTFVQRLFFVA